MARRMTDSERRAFLTEGTRTGKLATVQPDGRPHVVPIWFVLDDDDSVVFNVGADSAKGRAMRREPRLALCVDAENPPYAFVLLEGRAEISDEPEGMLE